MKIKLKSINDKEGRLRKLNSRTNWEFMEIDGWWFKLISKSGIEVNFKLTDKCAIKRTSPFYYGFVKELIERADR